MRDAGFTYLHARIVTEYIEVLHLPAFPFSRNEVAALTALIEAGGVLASPVPLAERLPDIDDEPFLEVAIAARAGCLVTGNRDHFPPNRRAGVRVVSPREFIGFEGPAFLEVIIDPDAGVYPMVGPGLAYEDMITGDFIPSRAKCEPGRDPDTSGMF